MAKTNVRRNDRGAGADLINYQRAMDEAQNEKMKEERGTDKLDSVQANRRKHVERKTTTSEKKAGRSKH